MKKLNLTDLRVTSFITELRSIEKHTVNGGIVISPHPKTYGCPSVDGVGCLPPKSEGCFSEGAGFCTQDGGLGG